MDMTTAGTTARPGTGQAPVARGTVETVARGLTAAAVLLSAVVHLELWALGMRTVAVIGPAFLANAIGGLVIGLAVLLWWHWVPLVAAIGFAAATLGAFVLSVTVGLLGPPEPISGVPQLLAGSAEVVAIGCAVVAWTARAGRRPPSSQTTSSQPSSTQPSRRRPQPGRT